MKKDQSFEKEYLKLFYEKQNLVFKHYTTTEQDFKEIDSKIYYHLRTPEIDNYRFLLRQYIDASKECSALIAKIDDLSNYDKFISSEAKKNGYQYKVEVSSEMRSDVIKLMRLKDKNAMYFGWNNYADLILAAEGYRGLGLQGILNDFIEENIEEVRKIILRNNISFSSWFEDLDHLAASDVEFDSNKLISDFLTKFGWSVDKKINITFDRESIGSFALQVAENEIEVVVKETNSLRELLTLFHELGHALYYSLIKSDGLNQVLSPSLDEVMAVVIEFISVQTVFDKERDILNEIMLLEYTRCAISALFELDILDDVNDAEEKFKLHYSKLGFEIENPEVWAYDSFRSLDSVYIHNYTIGYIVANKAYSFLQNKYNNDYKKWGKFLTKEIFSHGSSINVRDVFELFDQNDN